MIFRTKKEGNPFVQVDKYPLNDKRLSWKAKGLITYLLSKPNDWKVILEQLIKASKDGRDSTRSGIQELIDLGYVEQIREHREDGTFAGFDFHVYENPSLNDSNALSGNPNMDKPISENPKMDQDDSKPNIGKPENGSESNQANVGKPENGSEQNEANVGLSNSGKPEIGKSASTNNDLTNNETTNKDSLDSDSSESPSCLPDKDAFDYLLADLEVDDYPKHSREGKILRFTIWFYQRVAEQFGHHKNVQKANLFKWKEHIRLLVEQDGISLSRQLDVARWVFNDSFWRTVIRSTSNFRDEWEDIDAAIMREADTQEDQKKNRRKFTRYEGEMLMLDNGLLHNKRKGGGYEFEDVFEHLEGEGKQAVYVIKKSCLNLFKTWSR